MNELSEVLWSPSEDSREIQPQPQNVDSTDSPLGLAPRVLECPRVNNASYNPFFDLECTDVDPRGVFEIPRVLSQVTSKIDALVNLYLPDSLISDIVLCSNKYFALKVTSSRRQPPITETDILQFISIMFYLGVVQLPGKLDLWSTHPEMPLHAIANEDGMSRDRFSNVWRNIALVEPVSAVDGNGGFCSSDDEEGPDNEDKPITSWRIGDNANEQLTNLQDRDSLWFAKVSPLVNHVRNVSMTLLKVPGFSLSIDEMMVRFNGRSGEIHRMKNKPIGEGYKFFSIVEAKTGFACYFFPDGRLAANRNIHDGAGRNKFGREGTLSKTAAMVRMLVKKVTEPHTERNAPFVVVMDNYFTLPNVMLMLREMGVGCVGTSRPKRGWPPSALSLSSAATFNDLYYCVDDHGTLVSRWIDNNVVLLVSTVHTPTMSVERIRRRPRPTATHRNHLQQIWGQSPLRSVAIPRMVDDYKHWMGGVDLADQRIASYAADLRCRRTWMPMLLQCLHIIRNNTVAVQKELSTGSVGNNVHKNTVLSMVSVLRTRARSMHLQIASRRETRAFQTGDVSLGTSGGGARNISYQKIRSYSEFKKKGSSFPHTPTCCHKQPTCRYCSYLKASFIKGNPYQVADVPKPRKPSCKCGYCDVHLCSDHFNVYHDLDS